MNLRNHKSAFEHAKPVFDDLGVLDESDETMEYGEDCYRAVRSAKRLQT